MKKAPREHRTWKPSITTQRSRSVIGPNNSKNIFTKFQCVEMPSNFPVFLFNLGNLCLGQGMIPISCGNEIAKFKSCGMKKSIKVLLKCPRIPTTAKVIPAK